jgi:sporulation protein YlmC with PRC-barrel domain
VFAKINTFIKTSDGAEAGRVEYIVLEPSSQRVVSTIVTGGVVGSKFVAVPFSSMQFTNDREIALTEITRERIISAPVIERTQITSRNVIEPTFIERTYNHYGVSANVNVDSRSFHQYSGARAHADRCVNLHHDREHAGSAAPWYCGNARAGTGREDAARCRCDFTTPEARR